MNIDEIIYRAISSINEEAKKSEKPKAIRAKVGRGNIKKYIREGKARAENDPENLLKDLGVDTSALRDDTKSGSGFRDKIAYIVGRSIQINEAMAVAFTGMRYEDGSDTIVVRTDSNLVNSRDGALYMNNVLKAAQNSETISIKEDVDIMPGGTDSVDIKFIPLD